MGRAWRGPIRPPEPQGIMRPPELCHLPVRGLSQGCSGDLLSLDWSLDPNGKDRRRCRRLQKVPAS